MNVLKVVLISILTLAVILTIIGLMTPQQGKLSRSITIRASAESIFEEVNGMKKIHAWGPWNDIDPEGTQYTFEGPETGVGSKYSWSSEQQYVGIGRQEIIKAIANQKVRTRLFFGDDPAPNYTEILITPKGKEAEVVWTMEWDMGCNPFFKLLGYPIDDIVGPKYEEGLENLKQLVESKPTYSVKISTIDKEAINYLSITESFDLTDTQKISAKMGELYGQLVAFTQQNNIGITGNAMTVTITSDGTTWQADVAVPVSAGVSAGNDNIALKSTTSGKTVKAVHVGAYHKLGETHGEIGKYMKDRNLSRSGNYYEVYVTDPAVEPDTANWMTEIYYPVN